MSKGVNKVILDLYQSGKSIPEVSEEVGKSRSAVRYQLKKHDALRTRAEGVKLAGERGRLGSGMRGKQRIFTEAHKRKIAAARLGSGCGVSVKPNGYREITTGENKGKGEHRVIVEGHLGRFLGPDECVHHRNHDRSDNRIENLEVMSRSKHARLHAFERLPNMTRDRLGRFV